MPTIHLPDGTKVDLCVDDADAPAVLRAFAGATPLDCEVDALPLPLRPIQIVFCIQLLRWYRRVVSPRLGSRCVLDPSCSRYAALEIREHGMIRGIAFTMARLV